MCCRCTDWKFVENVGEGGIASNPITGSTVKMADGGHKTVATGQLMPSMLLSRSATEFDLECETDAVYVKAAKRLKPDESIVMSSAADTVSGGVLVAAASVNSVDGEVDTTSTDTSTALDSSAAVNEDVLPHLKHRRNYNTKASHINCIRSVI